MTKLKAFGMQKCPVNGDLLVSNLRLAKAVWEPIRLNNTIFQYQSKVEIAELGKNDRSAVQIPERFSN
jgi:hypothetical protein